MLNTHTQPLLVLLWGTQQPLSFLLNHGQLSRVLMSRFLGLPVPGDLRLFPFGRGRNSLSVSGELAVLTQSLLTCLVMAGKCRVEWMVVGSEQSLSRHLWEGG